MWKVNCGLVGFEVGIRGAFSSHTALSPVLFVSTSDKYKKMSKIQQLHFDRNGSLCIARIKDDFICTCSFSNNVCSQFLISFLPMTKAY